MNTPLFIGSLGAGLILIAFILGQLHVWKDTYLIYDLLNALGGLMLVYYAWVGNSWPFLILNGVWALISLKETMQDLARNSRRRNPPHAWKRWMH